MDFLTADAILFDLDGVLIDSEQKYTEIWDYIDTCYPTGVEDFAIKIKGTTLDEILASYFRSEDLSEVRDLLHELESKIVYEYMPGAYELLQYLEAHDKRLGLVTSSDHVKMDKLFRNLPTLRPMLHEIIMAEDVSRSKPDPEGYKKCALRLGVDVKNCIVVEDSVQGVKAGKSAGAKVLGFSGTVGRNALETAGADVIVDSLRDLISNLTI